MRVYHRLAGARILAPAYFRKGDAYMNKQAKRKWTTLTFKTKSGNFIVFPANNGKVSIKVDHTTKGQLTLVGYYDLEKETWHIVEGVSIPYGVREIVEQEYA